MYRLIVTFICILALSVIISAQEVEERVVILYNQAEAAYEKGELLKAIELYREAIKLAPELFEPKFQCATACLATGKPELEKEAVVLLKQVVTLKPDFARGHATLGSALAKLKDQTGAEQALRQALALDNKLTATRSLLAELLVARKAYQEAESELQKVIATAPADPRSYLILGLVQQQQGQLEAALASFTHAIELNGRDGEARYRRGRLYSEQRNWRAAIADLKIAYEITADPETGYRLAESYAQDNQTEQASELAKQLLAKTTDTGLQSTLASLLARLGANTEAIIALEKQLQDQPENVEYLVRLAELIGVSDLDKAIKYWERAVKLAPKAEYQVGLASLLLKAQRFDAAIHHFTAALAQKRDYYEAHAGLGLALFKLERFAPAAEQFILALRAQPDNTIGYYFLGICFDRLGDLMQALKAYELFLAKADKSANQFEIDSVNARLPSLRRQLEKQPGPKKK
ncbi:MAG: tetratricopeptide repeat protein [Acidobacteriota bacterium]